MNIACLMGPTASGKTDLALAVAQRGNMAIVSVDSALIYRGMDIGTAKPSQTVLQEVPHYLIDICDPTQVYSAQRFCKDALAAIKKIIDSGKTPLLVGGTMLYFRALQRGLATLPEANPEVRAAIQAKAKAQGWPALHQELQRLDPKAAARIHSNDSQRIQRALEVHALSGQDLTSLQQQTVLRAPYQFVSFGLWPEDRAELHRRIADRFDKMLAQGFVEEVTALLKQYDLQPAMPALRAVGYRQMWHFLKGDDDFDTMRAKAIAATRQLAKRQITWLRTWPELVRCPLNQNETCDPDHFYRLLQEYSCFLDKT